MEKQSRTIVQGRIMISEAGIVTVHLENGSYVVDSSINGVIRFIEEEIVTLSK